MNRPSAGGNSGEPPLPPSSEPFPLTHSHATTGAHTRSSGNTRKQNRSNVIPAFPSPHFAHNAPPQTQTSQFMGHFAASHHQHQTQEYLPQQHLHQQTQQQQHLHSQPQYQVSDGNDLENSFGEPSYMEKLDSVLSDSWRKQREEIDKLNPYADDMFHYEMPLARIKKIMRFDPTVVMIGADAPILLSKACELLIGEITARAWHHCNFSRRRTIKFSDMVAALPKTDVFDFLIDIVPRDDTVEQEQEDLAQMPQAYTPIPTPSEVDSSQSQKKLAEMVPKVMNILKGIQTESSDEQARYSSLGQELRLPDVSAQNVSKLASLNPKDMLGALGNVFEPKRMNHLMEVSKKKLKDFPEKWLPAMLLILQASFVLNNNESEAHGRLGDAENSLFEALPDITQHFDPNNGDDDLDPNKRIRLG